MELRTEGRQVTCAGTIHGSSVEPRIRIDRSVPWKWDTKQLNA